MAYAGTVKLGEIAISYECENCGKQDSYIQDLSGNYTDQKANYIGPGIAAENRVSLINTLQEKKASIFECYDGIKVRKCPQCGRHQTWMRNSLMDRNIQIWLGIVVSAVGIIAIAISLANKFDWMALFGDIIILGIVGLIVWGILYVILKGIFQKRIKTISQMNLKKPPILSWKAA